MTSGVPYRMARARPLLLALLLTGLVAAEASAAGRPVSIRGANGRTIAATLTEAGQRPSPAVVLVGMLGRPKDEWDPIAQRLADGNITALAIDLPGQVAPDDPKALAAWADDVRAGVEFLQARPETRPGAVGIVGASLGASLAAWAGATDGGVRALVLVSPAMDYRGLRLEAPMHQLGARPLLMVASQQDPYAARTVRDLMKDAPAGREAQWSDVSAHGTLLLVREPDLVRVITEWLQRTLVS